MAVNDDACRNKALKTGAHLTHAGRCLTHDAAPFGCVKGPASCDIMCFESLRQCIKSIVWKVVRSCTPPSSGTYCNLCTCIESSLSCITSNTCTGSMIVATLGAARKSRLQSRFIQYILGSSSVGARRGTEHGKWVCISNAWLHIPQGLGSRLLEHAACHATEQCCQACMDPEMPA